MNFLTCIRHVILSLMLTAATAGAQTPTAVLIGRVIDARTAQPLPRALIRVEHHPVFAETAADGTFRLTVAPGVNLIVCSLIGYAEVRREITVAADQSQELIIELSEGAGQYEERITVPGSFNHDAVSTPAGAVLHGRDLQALRGVMMDDPLRAVQSLPAATSTDDFYAEFSVRGSSFRHVGLAIDGIPAPYLMHGIHGVTDGGSIAMINSEALGTASLLPGSYPQRTGRRLGAHLDLTTRDGSRDGFHTRAGLSGTSANVIVEGPLPAGRGAWLASVRRSYLDYLLARIDPEGSFGFGFTDGLAKLTLDLGTRHQLQVLNVFGRSVFDENPEEIGVNDEALAKSRAWLSGLTWRFTPSSRVSMFQRVYVTGKGFHHVNGRSVLLDRGHDRAMGWRTDATIALGGHLAEFGGDVQHVSHSLEQQRTFDGAEAPTPVADYSAPARAASAYGQLTARFGAMTLRPGARVDYWGATHLTAASPWLTGELRLSSTTRLKGGAGIYRQPPDLSYLHGLRGNRHLADERAKHADLTLAQSLPGDFEAQLTGFARDERDVLWSFGAEPRRLSDGTVTLGRGDARWENRLTGRARGVEMVIRRDSPDGLSGWIAYAFSRHRYGDLGAGEHFWSDHDQRHTLSAYVHARLSNRTSMAVKLRYGSNYPITGYIGELPMATDAAPLFGGGMRPLFLGLITERNTMRLPPYVRLDVRADRTMTIAGRRVTFFVEVANALNRRNERNVPYSVQGNGRVSGVTDSLLPIVPSAGFVVEF